MRRMSIDSLLQICQSIDLTPPKRNRNEDDKSYRQKLITAIHRFEEQRFDDSDDNNDNAIGDICSVDAENSNHNIAMRENHSEEEMYDNNQGQSDSENDQVLDSENDIVLDSENNQVLDPDDNKFFEEEKKMMEQLHNEISTATKDLTKFCDIFL